MTILFLCHEYPPYLSGGIGVFVKSLAEALVKENHTCVVVGVYPMAETIEEEIEGVNVFRLGIPKKKFSLAVFNLIYEIRKKQMLSSWISKWEKKTHPNLIESFEWSGPLFKKPKTTLLVRLHGSHSAHAMAEKKPLNPFLFFWEKRNYQMADVCVAVSEHIKHVSRNCFGEKKPVRVIYNPIHPLFEKTDVSSSRDENRILFVGKYHERKGVFELALILNELLPMNKHYVFVFVGYHTEEQHATFLTKVNVDLHSRITFYQALPQEELKSFYQNSSLMIMPTHAEAFGLTAIEAMACGCVVAMNRIASAPEIIQDRKEGLLIDIRQPRECAKQIHEWLTSEDKNTMRVAAREKVLTQFSMKAVLHKNVTLYHELVSS